MFHTAFVRSNTLMLSRDEIDILWDAKDQFPKDFKAEVLFLDADAVIPDLNTATVSEMQMRLKVLRQKDCTPDDGIHKQVGKMDSGISVVKDISVDDVNYMFNENMDSDPHAVKDIAVDDGEIKSTFTAVTSDVMKPLETKEVTVDVHQELAILQTNVMKTMKQRKRN
ncbi:Tensin phosphatase, C2 domain [Sesbania bispinosa]|nr:Tensin phosphatase, C2 domain [Sesbania bispinosa]